MFLLYVFGKVSISETHRIPGGLPPVAVCVQPSVFQLSHTHSALECVSAAPAGLLVCQRRAHKSYGRTGVQFNIEINTCQQILSTYVWFCLFHLHNIETYRLFFFSLHQWAVLFRAGPYWCFTGFHGNRAVQCSCCDAGGGSGVPGVPCRQGQNSQAAWNCPLVSSCHTVKFWIYWMH